MTKSAAPLGPIEDTGYQSGVRPRTGHPRAAPRFEVRFRVVVQADEFLPRPVVIVAPTVTQRSPSVVSPAGRGRGEQRWCSSSNSEVDVERLGKRAGRLSVTSAGNEWGTNGRKLIGPNKKSWRGAQMGPCGPRANHDEPSFPERANAQLP